MGTVNTNWEIEYLGNREKKAHGGIQGHHETV